MVDEEIMEYSNQLRNGILEAYSGIFRSFKNSPKTQLLLPYASHILHFLGIFYKEGHVSFSTDACSSKLFMMCYI